MFKHQLVLNKIPM